MPVTSTLISIIITIYHQGERVGCNIRAQHQDHHHAAATDAQVGWWRFMHQDEAVGTADTSNKI